MNRLQGKVAIITGGAMGIGKETARQFIKEGAAGIAICDFNAEAGAKSAEELAAQGADVRFYDMDVREADRVAEVFKRVRDDFGKIDILINNAGVTGPMELPDEITVDQFDDALNTDLRGSFICAREVIQYFREVGGGSIVNLCSICGLKAEVPGLVPYHVSKAGVLMLTKVFAVSYAKENIRCNCVCPGTTLTELIQEYGRANYGSLEAYEAEVAPCHPMNRLGKPEEVAMAIVYLASDEASWTTGAHISVDGGWSAN